MLEFIHTLVETLDKYFENVCELDIMFNIEKAHFIIDEMMMAGYITETNKANFQFIIYLIKSNLILLILFIINLSTKNLLVFFRSQLAGVGNVNVQSLSSFNDNLPLLGRNTLSDLSSKFSVGHHQAIQFLDVVNQELFETHLVPAAVSGFGVGTETDGGHGHHTGESSPEGRIDTSGFSPS